MKLWLKISSSWGTLTIRFIHILWKDSICLVYWPRAHGNDVRTVLHLNMVKDNLHKNMTREKHTDRVWCSELCRICGECQRLNIIHNSSSCGVYFFRTFCICVGRYTFLCFITFEKERFTCFLEELCLKVPLTTKMLISFWKKSSLIRLIISLYQKSLACLLIEGNKALPQLGRRVENRLNN